MNTLPKHNTVRLAFSLLRLALQGWKQVPGYTVAERDQNGDIYVAVQLRKPGDQE